MLFLKTQCTFHNAKSKSNHHVRFPSYTLYPQLPVVWNYTWVSTKHEVWVSSDIGHEFSPADCKALSPLIYCRTFWLSYMGISKFHPHFLGQYIHFFAGWNLIWKEHEKYHFLWVLSLPESCINTYSLKGRCLQSPFIYSSYTSALTHKQILSMWMQTGIGKRHCTALWMLMCQKEQECKLPMVVKEIKSMSCGIGCLLCFPSLPLASTAFWVERNQELEWGGDLK